MGRFKCIRKIAVAKIPKIIYYSRTTIIMRKVVKRYGHIYTEPILIRVGIVYLKLGMRTYNFLNTHRVGFHCIIGIGNGYRKTSVAITTPLYHSIAVATSWL